MEHVISLCMLCYFYWRNFNQLPKAFSEEDNKRLIILTEPIRQCMDPKHFSETISFRKAINQAKERELGDLSLSSSMLGFYDRSNTDNSKTHTQQAGSDDDISSNMASFISECSFNNRSIHDGGSDAGSHDRSKMSLRRSHKNILNNKIRRNQNLFLSPYRRSVHSPKLTESRKIEQKLMKDKDNEIRNLKEDNYQLSEDLGKLEDTVEKLNTDICKLKTEKKILVDDNDCLKSVMEDNSILLARKEKELEKLRKDFELSKKTSGEKSDEIKQLKNSNNKLQQDIVDLNNKLKRKFHQYEESMKIESGIDQKYRGLIGENEKLKDKVEELEKQIKEMENIKSYIVDRESLLTSPISNIELGESLDIINQVKLTEMKEEFESKINKLEYVIETLKSEKAAEKCLSNNLLQDKKELELRYNDAINKYQLKLCENEEIAQLKKMKLQNEEILSYKSQMCEDDDEINLEKIKETIEKLFSEKYFTSDEKHHLLKWLAEFMGISFSKLERNHSICQNEISVLSQQLRSFQDEIIKKDKYIKEISNYIDDEKNQMDDLEHKLAETLAEKEEIERLLQSRKSKSDEAEFKLKKTLLVVDEEKKQVILQNSNLTRELFVREQELQKSNQEFNHVRARLDQSLQALERMSIDIADYEQVLLSATAENNKTKNRVYRSISTQTENPSVFDMVTQINSGSKVVDNLERGNSFRDYSGYKVAGNQRYNVTSSLYGRNTYNSNTVNTPNQNRTPLINKSKPDINLNFSKYDQERLNAKKMIPDYNESSDFRNLNETSDSIPQKLNPKWIEINELNSNKRYRHNIVDKKPESPSVKPARLQQMISRNLQQPDHLKSSYPVETQAIDQGFLANWLVNKMNLEDSDIIDTDNPQHTARSSIRHYSSVDPMNLRPNINSQGMINCENPISDELIKASNNSGLAPRNVILSARSSNFNTPRNEVFKKPFVPQLQLFKKANRDSDRENAIPLHENKKNVSDGESDISTSMRFDIINSPKTKIRGMPRRNSKVY